MRKIFLLLVLLICSSLFAQKQESDFFSKMVSAEQKAHSGLFTHQQLSTVPNNYDIHYLRMEWTLDPAVNYVNGVITTWFSPTVNSFNQIQFDLDTSLTVDSVKYHGSKLIFNQLTLDALQADFQTSLTKNVLDSVTIYYQGIPASNGFGSWNQSSHNGVPITWTLSEPFGAKDWWPCKQSLNDKADSIDVIVTTPAAYRAASNGLLLSEKLVGSNKIYHWKSTYPIAAYLIAIAVTNYSFYSDYVPLTNDSIEVLNYVYPENLASAKTETPDIINVIKLYDSLCILYPFSKEKYGHAQFGWGGGMEHQTMSFVNNFSHELIAHECAHQWFGDHITCGSWEDIWLNEGFATYFEGLTEERYFPSAWYNWRSSKLTDICSQPDGSVKCTDSTDINRIFDGRLSYNKGAYLLRMLRWKLGDSLFFKSIRNYLNDASLAYNYAKTPNLIYHLENASGQNLTSFFNEWYYGQGYPTYHVSWSQEGSKLNVTISQEQSHSSVAFFEMPVPIRFKGLNKDTIIVFNHTFSGQNFTANISFHASMAVFDPELQLISAKNTVVALYDELGLSASIHLMPNPADKELDIVNTNPANAIEEVWLCDALGKAVSKNLLVDHVAEVKINISTLAAGSYLATVRTTNGAIQKKFIKTTH